jgi:hemerythrin
MIQIKEGPAVGHSPADEDHKRLLDSLKELDASLKLGAGRQQIDRIVAFLSEYTKDHYSPREAHLQRVGCPPYGESWQEHQAFIQELDVWVSQLRDGASTTMVIEVYRETAAWIRGQIEKAESKLRSIRAA